MLVRRAEVIPVECVARGYLTGSGWSQYRKEQAVCGIGLPAGLIESERLPEPIFTPTTKAAEGHDLPLTPAETAELIGEGLAQKLKELTLTIYGRAADIARERGIILADTKFEFGFVSGEIVLIDEVCTPDSSRFWPVQGYRAGHPQPSYDKQYVRDWLDRAGWDHEPPPPELPGDVVQASADRYREAYELIVGEPFAAYRERMGIA
jgi:phosphoribosylaminoimidazole-succinocarboxamide synthase